MSTTALFNDPAGPARSQYRIVDAFMTDVEAAPAGSDIEVITYSLSLDKVSRTLGAAARRKCRVRVIVDGHDKAHSTSRLKYSLSRFPGSGLRWARGAVRRPPLGNTHAKTWKIIRPDGSYIVYIGSSNLTGAACIKQYQDMVRIESADADLLRGFRSLFEEQWEGAVLDQPYRKFKHGAFTVYAFPHPLATPTSDPVVTRFNWLAPHADGAAVNISMHGWNDNRGIYLAARCKDLADRGAYVRCLLGIGTGRMVRNILEDSDVRTRDGHWPRGRHIHNKLMMARVAEGPRRVWTGSDNWSDNSLRQEEIVVKVRNDVVYDQYVAWFEDVWRRAR